MNSIKRSITLVLTFLAFSILANSGKASIPEHGSWERLSQTFEEGHWIVDEECTGIGEICIKDDFRTITIKPE